MSTAQFRDRLDIVREIHGLTAEMSQKQNDADFLIESVDARQKLMSEYDKANAALPPLPSPEMEEAQRLIQDVVRMDKDIRDILRQYKEQAKDDLKDTTKRQKLLLRFAGQSTSGSLLDIKK